jgi:hypothetical protein
LKPWAFAVDGSEIGWRLELMSGERLRRRERENGESTGTGLWELTTVTEPSSPNETPIMTVM